MTGVRISNLDQETDRKKILFRVLGRSLACRLYGSLTKIVSNHYARNFTIFDTIELETINRCNSQCSFCPVNRSDDPRPLKRMEEATFHKIISELNEIGYQNRIAFHSNNEPFLDKQLAEKISYTRQKLPKAYLYVYTNGTPLNFERYQTAMDAGLDEIVVDNYSDELNLNTNIKLILEQLQKPQYQGYASKTRVVIQKMDVVRDNRAGSAPNKLAVDVQEFKHFKNVGCTLPFSRMVVRPTGEVSLCCNDALGQVTLGDTRKQSLIEIWNGPGYQSIRDTLLSSGRKNLPLCQRCDSHYVSSDVRVLGDLIKNVFRRH